MGKAVAPLILALALGLLSSCAMLRSLTNDNFDKGMAAFNQGQFDSAIHYFRKSTLENPNSAQAFLYLGRSYVSVGRWGSAIQPLRTAFRLSPHETKGEIMNLIIDAVFAAATTYPGLGEIGLFRDLYQDLL
jgi:cytochrome c-type biogenesis protein CcmH/NrfG